MNKKVIFLLFSILIIVCASEVFLRKYYGFANAPLYKKSDKYEYILAPNQDLYRFRNHIKINKFSQRSNDIGKKKIILGLGDSVIYGGVSTDQDSLATSIVSQQTPYQMLNISAGSWGPDNAAAYLQEKGIFNAKAIILLVSSHDAYDNIDFTPTVGIHESYPDKQYKLAWLELLNRYIFPRVSSYFSTSKKLDPDQKVLEGIKKNGKEFNPGFNQIKEIAQNNKIPFFIILHPEKSEIIAKKYNEQGQDIINWANLNNVELYKELDYKLSNDMYRDDIHTNAKGQKKEAEIFIQILKNNKLL